MELGTKERILREAQRLIHTNGFRATSVDAIAKASGVKKANVFYYFPNKEELGLELLDRMATLALTHILTPTFDNDRHPTEQLRDYLKLVRRHMEESYCAGGCPLGNLALEMADVNEAFRTRLTQFFEAWESVIEGVLQRGRDSGLYRETMDPRATASFIVSALEGAILLAKTKRDPEVLAHAESHLVHLLEGYQV
ncbi:MAG: TetR family transcriptional regulator C-terminal domain-containing protein [Nitrospinae bacterium]|nr:TetR family transcriptional regulator C-terminal domain-containing protein [Nitrospinota bacterium]